MQSYYSHSFEFDISLNSNGDVLVIGAPGSDHGGANSAGYVRVYENLIVDRNNNISSGTITVHPNPSGGRIFVNADGIKKIDIMDISGRYIDVFYRLITNRKQRFVWT